MIQESALRVLALSRLGHEGAKLRMRAYWDTWTEFNRQWRSHYGLGGAASGDRENRPASDDPPDPYYVHRDPPSIHPSRLVDRRTPTDESAVMDVRAAVAKLHPSWRSAVEAIHLGGESIESFAAREGTTNGAVRARLHKALKALRESLKAYDDDN